MSPDSSPTEIKRYEVLGRLATGGMAEVFLARAKGLGGFEKLFVVKRIRPDLANNREMSPMILDEARIAATLDHPNIVHVFDVDIDAGTVFLVMEYLHGRDVREIKRRAWETAAGMPLAHALNIALGVCGGLHYAHEKADAQGCSLGIVHRDVSPHNVLVTYDGAVKVIDFGIAKATMKLTSTLLGMVKGKPGYMSPEQCEGNKIDRRSDVFCIAILLYEMTTGKPPYDASDAEQFFNAVLLTDAIRPSARVRGYPKQLERILMRGLERDRDRRYQSALEMHRDLEAFAHEARLMISPLALSEYMEQLFADERAALRAAEQRGALAEYVMAIRTGSAPRAQPGDDATTRLRPAPSTAPPPSTRADESKRPVRARAAVIGALALAGLGGAVALLRQPEAPARPAPPPTLEAAAPDATETATPQRSGAPVAGVPEAVPTATSTSTAAPQATGLKRPTAPPRAGTPRRPPSATASPTPRATPAPPDLESPLPR
jgi:serine/threonine protein kinase